MEVLEYKKLSLRDFLHVVFKRKKQILLFFLVLTLSVGIGTFVAKPTYLAKIQILVKMGRENIYVPPGGNNIPIISVDRDNQINSEIELLKNRSLVENVIKSLGLKTIYKNLDHKDAVLKFQDSLSIQKETNSNVITVRFKHEDPKLAATVINTFANAYLDQHLMVHKNPHSFIFFEEQSKILKNKLEQSEKKLKDSKNQHNVTALAEEQSLLLTHIDKLRAGLSLILSQEVEAKNRIRPLRPQEEKLIELELKESKLLTKYTPQSRLVQNVRKEIQMVREKLLSRNQDEKHALSAKKEIQIAQLAQYQSRLEELNRIEARFNQLQQAVDLDRQNYQLYMTKFEESRISDEMDNKKMANVSLIEPALPPIKPVSPKVLLNILIGIFLGGFGGLFLAFFTEYIDDTLEKPEDVEKVLQVPVLASIPEL